MSHTRKQSGWFLVEEKPQNIKYRVLLLPGAQGSDLVFSKLMAEPVLKDAGVHLIAGNPPGFKGQSVPNGFDFSMESYAAFVESLAEAEKINLIVGHSLSGNILIEVAARNKYKGKLMMISPSLDREAESKDLRTLDDLSRKPLIAGIIWQLTYMMIKSVFAPYFDDKELLKAVTADAKKIPKSYGRKMLVAYFDHIDKYKNLADRLITTKTPVWYVRGTKDDIGFTDAHRSTLQSCSLVKIKEVPDARHFAMCDKPTEVAQLILEALGE